jgi:hypothetical protein
MTASEFLTYERAAWRRLGGATLRRPEESLPESLRRRQRTPDEIFSGFRLAFPASLRPQPN